MKSCLVTISLLLLASSPMLADDADALIKDAVQLGRDLTEVLKPIKDKAGAEAAAAKLKALDERFSAVKKKRDELSTSAEEKRRLQAKFAPELETVMKGLRPELERIEKLPDVKDQLVKESALVKHVYELSAELDKAKVELARSQVFLIETAVQSYKVKTGEHPATLEVLTEGDKPYLDAKDLIDPWEKPYQYDTSKLSPTGKPHIWTVGPDKKVIANWDEEKKK